VTGTAPDGIQLSNGEAIEADLVLVGIGVEPVPTIAERLGLPSQGGSPSMPAAATADLACLRRRRRPAMEPLPRAAQSGLRPGPCPEPGDFGRGQLIGEVKEYNDPPWFWTDQYDLNIQVAGDMLDSDHIVRGDKRSGKFSIVAMRAWTWSVRYRSCRQGNGHA